jgi:DNA-directed RNA polymerase specialized sigma24 family protein
LAKSYLMSDSESVTRWIKALQQGDQVAATRLWDRYFHRLVGIARAQLGQTRQTAGDASDIALSAFHCFCRRVQDGRFSELQGRDELWRLLVLIAKRKAINWIRHEMAGKRGGGKAQGEAFLDELVSPEPAPEFTLELLDELRRLLEVLRQEEDVKLSLIAKKKSEGKSNREIASELSISLRSVERKFKRICILWAVDLENRDRKVDA